MAAIVTHLLRKTTILHRSRVVVANYRRSFQLQNNVSSQQNPQTLAASTSETSNTRPVNVTKLMGYLTLDANNQNRVNYKVLHNVITSAVKEYVPPSEGAFLLHCCTMLPDMNTQDKSKLIDTIWNDGILKSGDPTKEQIVALLRAYKVIGRSIEDFNGFLAQHNCVDGDVELYEEFLHLVCENGSDNDGIAKVLSDMKTRGFALTEKSFNALILGHSKNKSVENCEEVLQSMVASKLPPSSETYMFLVRAYIENGDITKATKILSEKSGKFSQEQSLLIIRTAAVNDSTDLVKMTMKLLPVDSLLNKSVVPGLRNICTELIHMDKAEMAYSIIDNLPKVKLTDGESVDSFGIFFINEMVRRNDHWKRIIHFAQRLVDSDRNSRALHCCCELMLRANSPNSINCLEYLGEREPLRPHYFWPLLLQRYRVDGESGLVDVLKEMTNLNVPVDEETVLQYVLPKLKITMKDPKQALKILCDEAGVSINILLTPAICHLLHQLRVNEALDLVKSHQTKVDGDQLFWPLITTVRKFDTKSPIAAFVELVHTIKTRSLKPNSDLIGSILIDTIGGKTVDASVFGPLLKQCHKVGLKIPISTCDKLLLHVRNNLPNELQKKCVIFLEQMLDELTNDNSPEQTVNHPRDMNLKELECHLIELQSKNLNIRGVLRRLLQLLVRMGKHDRALEVLQLCKENKVDLSPGMLASILDLMIHTKNLTEAEATFNQLKKMHPSFTIDEFKVIDLAALLIENEHIEKAREILKVRARSKLAGGTHCQKNIWALLTNVAVVSAKSGSSVNQSDEFLQFLIKLGYCTFHNTLGGPIIKEYLLKNEIAKAMTEFENLATKHKKTPMHFELMTTLIELSNRTDGNGPITPTDAKEMLGKIARTVVSIHGQRNANVSLIVAVAKAGTEGQLRKILMDPKLEFNADMLVKQCEYLSTVNAEATIFKLAKCSRGLGRLSNALKEDDLYNLLLNAYVRENNFSAALALFQRMSEDEDIRLTKEFTRKVADLFEKNNLELPAQLEMYLRRS